jgi:hypothetical protein
MASLGYYRFTRGGQKEQKNRPPWEQTEQFHAEFLQALALTLPSAGRGPSLGVASTELAAFEQKLPAELAEREGASPIEDRSETVVASLSRRLAGETRFARNWAYPAQLQRALSVLCEPLDEAYSESLGIRLSDLVKVIFGVIAQRFPPTDTLTCDRSGRF